MPMKNKIQLFLKSRSLTPYRFIQETGIATATGYKLAGDEAYLPSVKVLGVICDTYRVQPNEILEWVDEK